MVDSRQLTADVHRDLASRHITSAEQMRASAEPAWAVVAVFYSAYHLVRAALLDDPIWSDLDGLRRIDFNLQPDDRYTESHHGRRKPVKTFGVNELVMKLYPSVIREYERLHQASIDVRYGRGFKGSIEDVFGYHAVVAGAAANGDLKATPPPRN